MSSEMFYFPQRRVFLDVKKRCLKKALKKPCILIDIRLN
jgi:hypothetical protein